MECPWKYALGRPGEGFHAARLFGFAANDVYGTIAIGVVTAYFFDRGAFPRRAYLWVLGAFAAGILCHWAFCVPTTLNMMIFGEGI